MNSLLFTVFSVTAYIFTKRVHGYYHYNKCAIVLLLTYECTEVEAFVASEIPRAVHVETYSSEL